MKNYLIMIAVLFISCSNKQEKSLTSIRILYVNEEIERFLSVSCNSFEKSFSSILKEKIINDKAILQKIAKYITPTKGLKEKNIDVRTKVILQYENGTSNILCFDRYNNASIDGEVKEIDASFFKIIRNSINMN